MTDQELLPIPARAGMNRRNHDADGCMWADPRTGGDEPLDNKFGALSDNRSPHGRG